jgi:MFS family permease
VGGHAGLPHRDALKLALVAALIGAGAGLFAPYLNVFFVEALGASPAVYGWLSAAATLTRLVATLLAPALATRVGTARAIGWTQLVSVPLLLVLGFSPWLGVGSAAFLVRGALMNMAAPLQVSFRMEILPRPLHGSGNALIWLADSVVRAASTWLGGALIGAAGYRLPYLATAACYVASAGLFLWWFGGRAQPPARDNPARRSAAEPARAGQATG